MITLNGMQGDNSEIPSKGELLLQMARKQAECFGFFQQAEISKNRGDFDSARIWYEKLINASHAHSTTCPAAADPIDKAIMIRPLR